MIRGDEYFTTHDYATLEEANGASQSSSHSPLKLLALLCHFRSLVPWPIIPPPHHRTHTQLSSQSTSTSLQQRKLESLLIDSRYTPQCCEVITLQLAMVTNNLVD